MALVFKARQPLSDILTFDTASRGVAGSANLLRKQKGRYYAPFRRLLIIYANNPRHFAWLGCLAFILSIAFDPFVQNLVHYKARRAEDPSQKHY